MSGMLNGKSAIVTGASRGIGRAIAVALAAAGARVVCTGRSAGPLERTRQSLLDAGREAIAVTADLSSETDVQRVFTAALSTFGRLDILVNNAGDSGPTRPVEECELDEWRATIDSCLTTSFLCARLAVAPMAAAGGGVIVNISSMSARRGLAYRSPYCAAKAGQLGLTVALAVELGPRNIRVNAVVPAAVDGDRINRVVSAQALARGIPAADVRQALIDRAPLKRLSTAEDVASLVAFLCSPLAASISGQCIAVTAGESSGL